MSDSPEFLDGDRRPDRQNGDVPARRPVPDMPLRVSAIHHVIGSGTRLAVLRYLLDNPASTRQQIAADTGISVPAAGVALRELAEHGYVDADIPPELRKGRSPQYSVHRRRVIEDAGAFFAWLAE